MYSRQHRTSKSPSNNSDAAPNQFAPRRFVVQPKTEEVTPQQDQTPEEQTQKEEAKQYKSAFIDTSKLTPRPSPAMTPQVQMKLNIGQPGDMYEQKADSLAADEAAEPQRLSESAESSDDDSHSSNGAKKQGLQPQNKQQLVAGVPKTPVLLSPSVSSGPADLYAIKVLSVPYSGIAITQFSDEKIYVLTLMQVFGFTENEAKSLVSHNRNNLGISVKTPILEQTVNVSIVPKCYWHYTNLVKQTRNQQQVNNRQSQQANQQRQVKRQAYIDSLKNLSNTQISQLQKLFSQLDATHKNLVHSKILEQLQLIGGSASDAKLNEAIKYAVLYSMYPANVQKIIDGQVANPPRRTNVNSDSKKTPNTNRENQTAVINNPSLPTYELSYDNPSHGTLTTPNNSSNPSVESPQSAINFPSATTVTETPQSAASGGVNTVFGHTYTTVPITTDTDQITAEKTPPSTTTQEAQPTTTIAETSEQAYINQFINSLKNNARSRLHENSNRLQAELKNYDQANPKSQNNLQHLRQLIDTDKKLAQFQHQLEGQRAIPAGIVAAGSDPSAKYSDDRILPSEGMKQQAEAQLSELNPQIAEIQKIRKTLRVYYPAIAVLKTEEIQPDTPNQAIVNKISQGFQSIQNGIVDVEGRLEKNDIPLNKLGPIVSETLVQLGVNPENRGKDPKSKAILDYLEREERKDFTIQLAGTLTNIVLGVGAFFATGGAAIFLGIAAALAGLGTAAYELEQADDLYAAAKAGEAGGKPLVDDSETARFNLIMSWANVILAGLDLGFAVKGGTTLLETTSKARRMVKMHDADVLNVLKSDEIAEFKQAIQSLRTGKIKKTELPQELEQLKLKLKQRLGDKEGETVFTQAYSLFQRVELPAARVSELSGFKDLFPSDFINAVPIQIDASLSAKTVKVHYIKTDGLVSEFYIQVGPKAVGSDIREHVPTFRLMQRYVGSTGRVRMLRERLTRLMTGLGEPQVGTKAWEAKFEIEKLERIINGRVEQLAANTVNIQARIEGLREIEDINVQLNKFERTLATMDETPGVGYVAAQKEGRWIRINKGKISEVRPGTDGAFYINNEQYKAIEELPKNQRQTREQIFENLPENLRQEVQPTQATKKVVEEPKLSSVRSDYLGEYENVKLGQELGSGGNKDVYSVQGREDLAIGILREGNIDELTVEIEELQKLASEGLQTIEVLGTTTHNNRPAIVMKKYAQGSKDIVRLQDGKVRRVDGADMRLLNQNSIQDLNTIRSLIIRKKIRIDDLQFMVASDGHVYITDPIEVIIGEKIGTKQNNLDMIDLLIDAAQQNILERGR